MSDNLIFIILLLLIFIILFLLLIVILMMMMMMMTSRWHFWERSLSGGRQGGVGIRLAQQVIIIITLSQQWLQEYV